MWRPKDWKNPFNPAAITVRNVFSGKPISHNEAFEYGADAMLEALMKKGTQIPDEEGGYYKLTHWLKPERAKFVTAFSPDEENNENC